MSPSLPAQFPHHSRWRAALLVLAILLACTNIVELFPIMRAHYWDDVGFIGLDGNYEHGKLRGVSVNPDAAASLLSIQPGDLVTWETPVPGFAPPVLTVWRAFDRTTPFSLTVAHGGPRRSISMLKSQYLEILASGPVPGAERKHQ